MNRKTFDEYCNLFDTAEDKGDVFDRYYAPDAVFEHPLKGTFKGKDAIVGFWQEGHRGIHEVIVPVNVIIEGDRIAAEFRIEWHCTEDTNYLGPRKKGKTYYAECAAFYALVNDRFARVKLYLRET